MPRVLLPESVAAGYADADSRQMALFILDRPFNDREWSPPIPPISTAGRSPASGSLSFPPTPTASTRTTTGSAASPRGGLGASRIASALGCSSARSARPASSRRGRASPYRRVSQPLMDSEGKFPLHLPRSVPLGQPRGSFSKWRSRGHLAQPPPLRSPLSQLPPPRPASAWVRVVARG